MSVASPEGVAVISTVWSAGIPSRCALGTHNCPTLRAVTRIWRLRWASSTTTAASRASIPASLGRASREAPYERNSRLDAHIAGVMHSTAHASGALSQARSVAAAPRIVAVTSGARSSASNTRSPTRASRTRLRIESSAGASSRRHRILAARAA